MTLIRPALALNVATFDGATGALPSTFVSESGTAPRQLNGKLHIPVQVAGTGYTNYITSWQGPPSGGKFHTDQQEVMVQLIAPEHAVATNNAFLVFLCGSNTSYVSGVNVLFGGFTGQNGVFQTLSNSTVTTRATASAGGIPVDARVRVRRLVTSTGSTFQAFVNDSLYLTWNDTTGIIPKNANQRRWRLGVSGTYPTFNVPQGGPAIDWAAAYDLVA